MFALSVCQGALQAATHVIKKIMERAVAQLGSHRHKDVTKDRAAGNAQGPRIVITFTTNRGPAVPSAVSDMC